MRRATEAEVIAATRGPGRWTGNIMVLDGVDVRVIYDDRSEDTIIVRDADDAGGCIVPPRGPIERVYPTQRTVLRSSLSLRLVGAVEGAAAVAGSLRVTRKAHRKRRKRRR